MPTYNGNNGSNTINGSSGDDTINGHGGNDKLNGNGGNDTINGGTGHDDISGGSGDDTLNGGAGDDEISGGQGNDTIHGESDDDWLSGDDGNDFVYGAAGYDMLFGGSGDDTLDGGDHDDELSGGSGNDTLIGGNGNDQLSGDGNDDTLEGGSGNDALFGGSGNDTLTGGGGLDLIDGGSGTDTAAYTGSVFDYSIYQLGPLTGVIHNGSGGPGSGVDGADLLVWVERLQFADFTLDLVGNNAPIAFDDAAVLTEDGGGYDSGAATVLDNDLDFDGDTLTVTPAVLAGAYGTLTLDADGTYSYALNAAAQALAQGTVAQDGFAYTVSDGSASDTGNLVFSVTGLNDGPVANPDADATGENAVVLVDVLANDTDVDNGAVLTVTAASAPAGQGTAWVVGNQVQFDPGTDFEALAVGESEVVVVGYSIEDEHGASSASSLTITVTGTNDGPVAIPDTDSTSENAVLVTDVLANDADVDNGAVLSIVAASAPAGQGAAAVVGNQVQFDPGSDFDYLAVGESTEVVVSYSIEDEHGASSSSTLAVTVTGTNDSPTIDAGGTDAVGAVTELPNNDPDENAFTHSEGGAVAFDDLDLSDSHTAGFTPQGGGYLGSFALGPVDQLDDSVGWTFSVEDNDLDFLDDGETLVQTYTVEIDDGNGGTATQDVTITLTGAADGPQTEWYIDNSAVGSANLGTEADPYTSIAAFNAAQGGVGGPQVGATVYLLAGTGIYAEADGINLLDDQVLVGVADGPVRPTIVVTGAGNDGIELAQNNAISGLDIGDTADAGIVDGNGSVGTLTITDVGKFGTGQIVDIDQGGTLDVTLNSAESLASSDGAIDLAGLAGSFTVTGTTTITGIHSDGGIDITGSSLAATFAGGGTISTNNATAVNFVGNSGSLTLAGGLDIATTSGTGLNATGGGTVTAQGSGNSIAATTSGIALKVADTTIGAPGLTFESISAGTAVGTAGVGVSLVNTGVLGGLTVTGTGTAGSGGVIQNKTGADGSTTSGVGIYLESTSEVSLNEMVLHDFDNHGIFGQSVNGIRVTDSSIGGTIGTGTAGNDAAVAFGIIGVSDGFADGSSSLFDNVDISGGVEHNFEVYQTSGTFHLTITGSIIHDTHAATGADGLLIETVGSAHGLVRVDSTSFDDIRGDAVQATALGASHLELTLHDNAVTTSTQGNQGFILQNGASGDLTVAVTDNTFAGVLGTSILVGSVSGNATSAAELDATISGNLITLDAPATNRALVALFSSTVGQVSTARVTIDGNVINTIADPGSGLAEPLFVSTPDAGTDPLVHVTVSNNVVNIDDDAGVALRGITVQSIQNVSTMHADVRGNDVNYLDGAPPGVVGIRVRQANPATLDLEPGAGGATAAAVLANNNPLSTTQIVGTVTVSADDSVVLPPAIPATPDLPSFLLAGFDAGLLSASPANAAMLSQGELDTLADAAIDLLAEAGVSAEQIAALETVSFSVADLFGRRLGESEPGTVLLDSDAAGYGWDRVDALTVILHEFGHQLGLGDEHGSDAGLMQGYLGAGESRLPDGLFGPDAPPGLAHGVAWIEPTPFYPETTIL